MLLATSCGSGGDGADDASTTVGPATSDRTTSETTAATSSPSERHTVAKLEQALTAEIGSDDPPGPGEASCEASGTLTDWQPVQCGFNADEAMEYGPIYVLVLTGGRYIWIVGECCAGGALPGDYPPGLLCRDLIEPPPTFPPDHYLPESNSLVYGEAVYYWLTEGRPDRLDADGDGLPCETVYPADEVDELWASVQTL